MFPVLHAHISSSPLVRPWYFEVEHSCAGSHLICSINSGSLKCFKTFTREVIKSSEINVYEIISLACRLCDTLLPNKASKHFLINHLINFNLYIVLKTDILIVSSQQNMIFYLPSVFSSMCAALTQNLRSLMAQLAWITVLTFVYCKRRKILILLSLCSKDTIRWCITETWPVLSAALFKIELTVKQYVDID